MRKIKIGDCCVLGSETFICQYVFKGNPKKGETPHWTTVMTHCIESGIEATMTAHTFTQYPLPTLHLPISEPWFSRILSGEKTEEYREVKPFCCSRLGWVWNDQHGQWAVFTPKRDFKVLHLTHGYGHDKPQLWAHIESITIGKGNPEWGAPTEDVFIIRLGDVFHTKNLKK